MTKNTNAKARQRQKAKPQNNNSLDFQSLKRQYFPFLKLRKPKDYIAKGSFDVTFFLLVVVLLTIGLVMMFSASYVNALYDSSASVKNNPFYYIKNQLLFALIGLIAMYVISKIRYDFYREISFAVLLISYVLLILVLLFPVEIPGKEEFKRWLSLGFTTFQPSEIAKIAVIMYCAWSMERRKKAIYSNWKMMIPYMVVIISICGLVYFENHLSGTILILAIGLVMTFLGGIDFKWYIPIIAVGIIGIFVLVTYPEVLEKYAGQRIVAWLDKDYDPQGARWQTNQSLYAIGSGGLFGLGIGNSRQKHLYMPEPQNDFVFAIVCEELGFIRVAFIILLYVLLVWRGFVIAMRAKDTFSSLLVMGIVFQVGLQAALNIAVVSDFIPNTGISLPFFSYGGTSLVILLAEMGMVLGVSRYSKIQKT